MKKICAWTLCLCLIVSSSALAGGRSPMGLMGISTSGFWSEHPEISTREVGYDPWDDGDRFRVVSGGESPDLFALTTATDDLAAYWQAGLLMDLSGSEAIREVVARMRPQARERVCTAEGQIIGLPMRLSETIFYWKQDAWDAAGLTEADVPQSYAGLLDFLERWVERIKAHPERNVCVCRFAESSDIKEKYRYTSWLSFILLQTWALQQKYAGEEVRYDTPGFIALAERTRSVGLALYEAGPRQKKRQGMLELFMLDDSSLAFLDGGMEYGFSHAIPARITDDQPAVMQAELEVYCIRAGSPWADEALAALEYMQANDGLWLFYAHLYTDFAPGVFDRDYTVTEGWLRECRAYEGALAFSQTWLTVPQEEMHRQFCTNRISAEEYAKGLDEAK